MLPYLDCLTLCQAILTFYQEDPTSWSSETIPYIIQFFLANSPPDFSAADNNIKLLQSIVDNTNIGAILASINLDCLVHSSDKYLNGEIRLLIF